MAREAGAVVVEIYDQVYQLRGTDSAHIERLASIVDGKMRAVSAHGATVDSLRVAVLAALNIADELATLEHASKSQGSLRTRAHSLAGLLDTVLSEERKIG
jgi:cell division protein ZapA